MGAGVDERISQAAERGPTFLGLSQDPDVHHQVFERPTLTEIPEDQIEFSHDELEHVDLPVEELHQVRLDRVLCPHVDHVDLTFLAEAMDAPDPLLDPKRIPRKIVIHHGPSELEVSASPPASVLRKIWQSPRNVLT